MSDIETPSPDEVEEQQPPADAAEAEADAAIIGPSARTLFAVVNANGVLARGCGAVTSTKLAGVAGQYVVTFNQNVRRGAYVATLGFASPGPVPQPGEIGVAPRAPNPNAVFVQTRDSLGLAADHRFHLAVHLCSD